MINYKAEPYERQTEFETLPDGVYKGRITHVELKENKELGWKMLKIRYQNEENAQDKYSGRFVFDQVFLKYKHIDAEKEALIMKIHRNKLNGILEAIRLPILNYPFELVDKRLQYKIKTRPDKKDPTKMRTDVVDYFDPFYVKGAQNKAIYNKEPLINKGEIHEDVLF